MAHIFFLNPYGNILPFYIAKKNQYIFFFLNYHSIFLLSVYFDATSIPISFQDNTDTVSEGRKCFI